MLVVIDEGFKRHLGKKAECPICFNEKSLVPVSEWGHLVCEDCGPNLNMQKYTAHFVVVPLSRRCTWFRAPGPHERLLESTTVVHACVATCENTTVDVRVAEDPLPVRVALELGGLW